MVFVVRNLLIPPRQQSSSEKVAFKPFDSVVESLGEKYIFYMEITFLVKTKQRTLRLNSASRFGLRWYSGRRSAP